MIILFTVSWGLWFFWLVHNVITLSVDTCPPIELKAIGQKVAKLDIVKLTPMEKFRKWISFPWLWIVIVGGGLLTLTMYLLFDRKDDAIGLIVGLSFGLIGYIICAIFSSSKR